MAGFEAQAPMGRYNVNQQPGYESWRGSTTFGNNAGVDRALGAFDNAGVEASLAGGSSASSGGFNLPPDILDSMIGKGNDSINKAQDQALMGARNRAAASGFSVSGGLNAAEDQIQSDYASKRAGNERELRIADALNTQKAATASAGMSGSGSNRTGGGFAAAPQDTGLAEGITKGQQLSLMSSLLPRVAGGGAGDAYLQNTEAINEGRRQQKNDTTNRALGAANAGFKLPTF